MTELIHIILGILYGGTALKVFILGISSITGKAVVSRTDDEKRGYGVFWLIWTVIAFTLTFAVVI